MSTTRVLKIYFKNYVVGRLEKQSDDTLQFQYSNEWLKEPTSFQLTPSLPLREESFNNRLTRAFFNNLIPEGKLLETLSRWHKIPSNPFQFLSEFGSDCAGALIILPENAPRPDGRPNPTPEQLEELSGSEIDQIISDSPSLLTGILSRKKIKFSLAGAQDKIAVIVKDKKIFLPSPSHPTTHILKPPIKSENVYDSVFNEFFCMELARACHFKVPEVLIIPGKYPLFIIARYDRELINNQIERLHQFDLCQAQGIPAEEKYEESGGPSIRGNYQCILKTSSFSFQDLQIFLKWICFNLLIGNNDSHSKNISFVRNGDETILAPLYDLISTSVYPEFDKKFAFQFGRQRLWKKLTHKNFAITAKELQLSTPELIEKIFSELIQKTRQNKDRVLKASLNSYGPCSIDEKLSTEIDKRCDHFESIWRKAK